MSLDTRFSSAVHLLIMVSESPEPKSSADIARSIGTNPSYVRKLSGSLKKAGLVSSRQGVPGLYLSRPADQISLLDIALAAMDTDAIHLFEIHKNPNDRCLVGRHIRPVLTGIFASLDEATRDLLVTQTLQNCIDRMREEIKEEQNAVSGSRTADDIKADDIKMEQNAAESES